MKNFAILRSVPKDLTWQQMDAMAIQNLINMGLTEDDRDIALEPRMLGVSWVRSYWEQGSDWGICLYTGKDEETVRYWHDLCGGSTRASRKSKSRRDRRRPRIRAAFTSLARPRR